MAKIVINACYGGYGTTTQKAADRYFALSGKHLVAIGSPMIKETYFAPDDRSDPAWIKTIECIGEDANPDSGTNYVVYEYDAERFSCEIDEYDGLETIELRPIIDFNKIYGRDQYQVWAYLVGFGDTITLKNGPLENNKLAAALTDKKICGDCRSYGKDCGGRAGAMRDCDLWIDSYHNMQKQLAKLLEKEVHDEH